MESSDDKIYLQQTNQPVPSSFVSSQLMDTPPLPPRPSHSSANSLLEPPSAHGKGKTLYHSQQFDQSLLLQDPRSASTQSLVPAEKSNGKRTLLLIYLHGFLGGETSFHSFPAHVHNFVTLAVAKTHVVHTKIYPRYRSRRAIEHARDEFSSWLHPNESADTDVVLLGHSMGGILSAEVTLMASPSSGISGAQQFRHRILGTIHFDCPFLGLHPGIVFSGIGSLFKSAPPSPAIQVSHLDSEEQVLVLHPKNSSRASSPSDPNYDPPFPNDIHLPERKGWDNTLHFITKHSHDLTKAAKAYVTSHLEFGACVADYKGLQNRYMKLRTLEDIQTLHTGARRVRFLNYYTICHGRPSKSKSAAEGGSRLYSGTADATSTPRRHSEHHLEGMQNLSSSTLTTQSPIPSPRISVEEHRDGEVVPGMAENFERLQLPGEDDSSADESTVISKDKMAENATGRSEYITNAPGSPTELELSALTPTRSDELYSLAPLPSFPEAPQQYDPATYSDRNARNLAYKQYSTEFKSYTRALKAYDQAISDRLKSIEKQEKMNAKSKKMAKSQSGKNPPSQPSAKSATSPSSEPERVSAASSSTTTEKKKAPKDRRFCVLPPRINGQRDPCWVRVFMKDVDEVGAHCGLFVPGEHYEWLVNDVGDRIRAWVEGM